MTHPSVTNEQIRDALRASAGNQAAAARALGVGQATISNRIKHHPDVWPEGVPVPTQGRPKTPAKEGAFPAPLAPETKNDETFREIVRGVQDALGREGGDGTLPQRVRAVVIDNARLRARLSREVG